GKTLKLDANQHAMVDFKLVRAGIISGRVFEVDGRPAVGMTVQAYVERKTFDRHALLPIAATQTNDRGEYRLFGLAPASYIVGVPLLGAVAGVYESGTTNGFVEVLQRSGMPFPQLYYP